MRGQNGTGLVPSSYIERTADAAPPPPPPPSSTGGESEVEALYDFSDPSQPDNLDLEQGKRYTLLDDSGPDWWKAQSSNGKVGFVPAS